jgi:lysyl-tRNA synthetase, class I
VSACNASDREVLWGFIRKHIPHVSPATHPVLDQLVGYAINYFNDFVKPAKRYRAADEVERGALEQLSDALAALPHEAAPETIQSVLYDVARQVPRYQDMAAKGATPERPGVSLAWFNALYQILLGEERGPRFGSFVALFGVDETRALIADALAGKFLN